MDPTNRLPPVSSMNFQFGEEGTSGFRWVLRMESGGLGLTIDFRGEIKGEHFRDKREV